jgi:dolichol-phosphate mannosyltransferase
VIPTYNESENLPRIVSALRGLNITGLGFVIVDDGSPDGTGKIADAYAAQDPALFHVLHRKGKLGLGTAYIAGFKEALRLGAEHVVEMDADLSHPPAELPKLLALLDVADVATGSRYRKGGGVDPAWNFARRQISAWGNRGIRCVMGLGVKDATSGFKAFRRTALEAVGLDTLALTGFGFQAEMAYACQMAGLRIVEHPYVFIDRKYGKSKMSTAIAAEAFWRLTLIRLSGKHRRK